MSCQTCRFFDFHEIENDDDKGACRRYAPRVKLEIGLKIHPTMWPVVDEYDWCGEWEKYVEQDPAREI